MNAKRHSEFRGRPADVIPLEDHEPLVETAYLLKSSRNARRLLASIKDIEEGRGVERELLGWRRWLFLGALTNPRSGL